MVSQVIYRCEDQILVAFNVDGQPELALRYAMRTVSRLVRDEIPFRLENDLRWVENGIRYTIEFREI